MAQPVSLAIARHFPTAFNAGEGGAEKSRSWSRIGVDKETAEPLADKAAKEFDKMGVKVITSSDLPRATQSVNMIADRMAERPQVIATARARTWNTGEGGKPEKEAREKRKAYMQEPDTPMPGGESANDFLQRFSSFLHSESHKAQQEPDKKRALVLHGHQAMTAEKTLNGGDIEDADWDKLDKIKPGDVMDLNVSHGGAKLSPVGGHK